MKSLEQAVAIVHDHLQRAYDGTGLDVHVIDEMTVEKDYGWVFFYNSRKYLETTDVKFMLIGIGPIVVEKETGRIHHVGSAPDAIKDFEKMIGYGTDRSLTRTLWKAVENWLCRKNHTGD